MRAFIAFELPAEARDAIAQYQARLRSSDGFRRLAPKWVAADLMHLTLRFLGDVTDAQAEALAQFLKARTASLAAIDTALVRLVAFPSQRRARVLALELRADPELIALASDVSTEAIRHGSPGDSRDYVPHVTLARFRRPGALPRDAEAVALPDQSWRLTHLALFRSSLGPAGPQYRVLHSCALPCD